MSYSKDKKKAAQQLIQPRTLKGFRDYLPEMMIPRERLIEIARRVYRSYGFSPIDTPALEYLEILTGKGSEETDRQLYHFRDHGGRDVGMRFDLTVPLARFAAQHIGVLGTPGAPARLCEKSNSPARAMAAFRAVSALPR